MTLRLPAERGLLLLTLFAILAALKKSLGPVGITLYAFPLIPLLILWMWRAWRNQERLPVSRPWFIGLMFLVFWTLTTTALMSPKSMGSAFTWAWSVPLAMYAYCNYGRTFGYRTVSGFAISAAAIEVTVGMVQWMSRSRFGAVPTYFGQGEVEEAIVTYGVIHRVVGTIDLKNGVGMWFVMCLPFILDEVFWPKFRTSGRWRLLMGALAAASVLVCILSFSRGNLIGLAGATFLFFAAPRRRDLQLQIGKMPLRRALTSATVALLILGFISAFYLSLSPATAIEYVNAVAERAEDTGESADERLNQFRVAVLTMFERPIVGYGYENGGKMWTPQLRALYPANIDDVHNIFLRFGVEAGMPGFAAIVMLFLLPWLGVGLRGAAHNEDVAYACATAGFSVTAMLYGVAVHHAIWPAGLFFSAVLASRNMRIARQQRGAL